MVLVRSLGKGRSAVPRLCLDAAREAGGAAQAVLGPGRCAATATPASDDAAGQGVHDPRLHEHGLALASGLHLPRSVASSGGTNCPGAVEAHVAR
jgi:hypothetical protein